jgi:hypothetical protein
MLRNTTIALAAAVSLMLGAGALTPALANYSQCDEQPNAESCPTYAAPTLNQHACDACRASKYPLPQVQRRGCRTRRTLPRVQIAAGGLNRRFPPARASARVAHATSHTACAKRPNEKQANAWWHHASEIICLSVAQPHGASPSFAAVFVAT